MVGYLGVSTSDDGSSQQDIQQKKWQGNCAITKLTLVRNLFTNVSENRLSIYGSTALCWALAAFSVS
jgi:hypothetical protein